MLEGFTGYLLPWDQTAYWATTVGININGTGPIMGPFLAQFLQGGRYINGDTLSRFYSMHMLLLPGAIIALTVIWKYTTPGDHTGFAHDGSTEGQSGWLGKLLDDPADPGTISFVP